MRDYGIVSPKFWIGGTGKALRGNMAAQIVALYLMTSPHANMIGVFYCPLDTIAKETGLSSEGASEALQSLIEADFCQFDPDTEEVFACRMAAYQIGEQLEAKDNRCKGVARELDRVMSDRLKAAFRAIYSGAFHLAEAAPKAPPVAPVPQAPSEPLRSQKQDQKQDQKEDTPPGFARFWLVWPKNDRKEARGKCLDAWRKAKAESMADAVVAHVERMKGSAAWTKDGGQFVPAPLVYLNQRRWEGAEDGNEASGQQRGFV
jgi:hypothetical protein